MASPETNSEHAPAPPAPPARAISVAGSLEGHHRGAVRRALSVVTGWAVVRGIAWIAARVFSAKSPMTVTLDGDILRVTGHHELLGRVIRTYDIRWPIAQLGEIRLESRFPALPAALSAFAIAVGSIFGAKSVLEGAGVVYFPLVAIGLGAIAAGLFFEWVMRAVFPGVRGRSRLMVRAAGGERVVLTDLPADELDRLLGAVDQRLGGGARVPASRDGASSRPASSSTGS